MFGRRTKAKAVGKAARGAGKVAGGTGRVPLRSGAARRAARATARGGAKGAGKTALVGGKVLLKYRPARRAARGAGKVALKGGTQVLRSRESTGSRYIKYGLFVLLGFAVGALVVRSRQEKEISSPVGETWGTDTPLGTTSGTVSDPASPATHQRPEDPHRTGSEREYSDPSSGPLVGRVHRGRIGDVPEQQEEVEQRIRTRIGEDSRTMELPHINVEVNDGVAELRGPAPSEEVKEAAGEIAGQTEGVLEVRNLITVS
jgi:BON domain